VHGGRTRSAGHLNTLFGARGAGRGALAGGVEGAALVPLRISDAAHRLHLGLRRPEVAAVLVVALLQQELQPAVPGELVPDPPGGGGRERDRDRERKRERDRERTRESELRLLGKVWPPPGWPGHHSRGLPRCTPAFSLHFSGPLFPPVTILTQSWGRSERLRRAEVVSQWPLSTQPSLSPAVRPEERGSRTPLAITNAPERGDRDHLLPRNIPHAGQSLWTPPARVHSPLHPAP
jgi:hypothetical protein